MGHFLSLFLLLDPQTGGDETILNDTLSIRTLTFSLPV